MSIKVNVGILGVVVLLGGAGGCVERPLDLVSAVQPGDADLTCTQIRTEIAANNARAVGLVSEAKNAQLASIAVDGESEWMFGPALVAFDAADRDVIELSALRDRDRQLKQLSTEKYCGFEQARWIGQGQSDACGYPWALDLHVDQGEMIGSLWRGSVVYDIRAEIDVQGRVTNGLAVRDRGSFGWTGPKFVMLDVTLDDEGAAGEYRIYSDDRTSCSTKVVMLRTQG
jgi:hypothetical protein